MPGVDNKPEIRNDKGENSVPQPRQPTTLDGLLKFAIEATKSEDAPNSNNVAPLDDERKKWLEEAINSMSINVVGLLQKQIAILQNCDKIQHADDISDHLQAMDTILEYIDNIDIANDFHKIGGFSIFRPCLSCTKPDIRAGACNIIAELCQNNPYCQKVVLDHNLIKTLLQLLENDNEDQVCVKALYALSCIVRQNLDCLRIFRMHQGVHAVLDCMKKTEDRLRSKSSFLLTSLCRSNPDMKYELTQLEIVPLVVGILAEERRPSHEHVSSLLCAVLEDNTTAVNECRKLEHNFKQILSDYLGTVQGKDEFQNEEENCRRLLHVLFPEL